MIREMVNEFAGVEFYRSTFDTVNGTIVRIVSESDSDHGTIREEIYRSFAEKPDSPYTYKNKNSYQKFHEDWKKKFGDGYRRKAWSPSPETIDIKVISKCGFGCPDCVPPGTRILTPNGSVSIEDIKIGDIVYTYMHSDSSDPSIRVSDVVEQVFAREYDGELIHIELENGKYVEVTPEHEVFTHNRGYVRAGELTENDDLLLF